MVDIVLGAAVLLLIGGVLGSVLPVLPSGALSVAGVVLYAVLGGEPIGTIPLWSMLAVGVAATALEWFAGPIAARASGASTKAVFVATVSGFVLFLLTGPVGIVVGMVGGVVAVELSNGADLSTAAKRAVVTAAGQLSGTVFQLALTVSILLTFVLAVVL